MKRIEKEFYNPEKELSELYTEKWIVEKCKIKDVNDLLVLHHYWQDSDGELWVDFDSPMENVEADFLAYRKRKEYMQPNEIKELRQSLNLSVREFAELTGLGFSNISQIENNKRVQTKYQDVIFQLIKKEYLTIGFNSKYYAESDFTDSINKQLNDDSFDPNLISKYNSHSTYSYNNDKTLGDAA